MRCLVLALWLASCTSVPSAGPPALQPTHRDVEYRHVGNWRGSLDIYLPSGAGPHPTLVYFHGGGWSGGSKDRIAQHLQPYLDRGFAVVAPSYRLEAVAPAPAAAADALCALAWVGMRATEHGLDVRRVVVSGHSAGGHLALVASYLPGDLLDESCADRPRIAPAAVIAWNAPSNLHDYLVQRRQDRDPIGWLEGARSPESAAVLLSPVRHVRSGLPPTLSLHASGDPEVPHEQAESLHRRLRDERVPSRLVTLESEGHLTREQPSSEVSRGYQEIWRFLEERGVLQQTDER